MFKHLGHLPLPASDELKIWRYMDLSKYLSMLQTSCLFFPRAHLLGDRFEGSLSKPTYAEHRELMKKVYNEWKSSRPNSFSDITVDHALELLSRMFELRAKRFMVSCWHVNGHESAAMWKLYSRTQDSICIQSTLKSLENLLPDITHVGMVNYIDYENENIPEADTNYVVMHKRKSFEHERELRIIIREEEIENEDRITSINESGAALKIPLNTLISKIFVNPDSPSWFKNIVENGTRTYGVEAPVVASSLADRPLF